MIKSWCVLSFFFLSVIFHVFVLLPSIQMTEITKSTADTKYNNATIAERFFFGCSRYLPFLLSFFVKCLQKQENAHTFFVFSFNSIVWYRCDFNTNGHIQCICFVIHLCSIWWSSQLWGLTNCIFTKHPTRFFCYVSTLFSCFSSLFFFLLFDFPPFGIQQKEEWDRREKN